MPARPTRLATSPALGPALALATALLLLPAGPSAAERAAPAAWPAADRAELKRALDALLEDPALRGARVGVCVAALDGGEVLYGREPDLLLNPASNVKLFTAAAALARLGPEYRFVTEVLTDGPPARGEVGTLYVRGRGDPSLVTERLWALAGDVAHHGLRTVRGDLVVDDGFFDAERQGPGYDQEEGDRPYLAPVGALSLNFNSVGVQVGPGDRPGLPARVALEPESEHLELVNRVRTVKPSGVARVQLRSERLPDGRQRIVAEGAVRAGERDLVLYRRIEDPPAYFGASLRRLLALRGVTVRGRVRRGTAPEGAHLLTTSQSEGLGAVVRALEKNSNNFMAEQLLKTLGAERSGPPGSWASGVDAVAETLAAWGVPRGSYVLLNGSGLNDTNRFTARQTVTVLREAWRRFPVMADYVAALPIAGRDGTTRARMEETGGRVRAKTGTLENASSLSGYVETARGERLAFSVLVNDFAGRVRPVVRAVDAIASALAAWGAPPSPVAAAAGPGPGAGVQDGGDLRAQVETWYRLGRSGDPRGATLLRAALRGERDPARRLALAEAAYLAEPGSASARRAFTESASPAGAAALVRALGRGIDDRPPVLGSLADLAAEGSDEALARLVELAPALGEGTSTLTPEAWDELARAEPEGLARALTGAPAAARATAVAALAAARPGPDHPLRRALEAVARGVDAPRTAAARELLLGLEAPAR